MKKIYAAALLLCFFLTISKPAQADHLVGSDITYQCTGTPGIFSVTLVLYRDCNGIPMCTSTCGAPCSRTLVIKGADPSCANSNFGSFDLSLVSVKDYDKKTTCPNAKNVCENMGCVTAGTFTPAVERYEFQGFVNIGATSGIPTSCCNVRFVFEECCRSAAIQTGSSWQNFYVDAVVNRCLSVTPCNSSPKFTTEPYDIVCSGEPVQYNNGVIEPDRDSLSFEFTPALQGFGTSVTYDAPWAYDKPMPWTGAWNSAFPGGIRCDGQTGDIMFTPQNASGQNFTGIVAILVKQWKQIDGIPKLVGTTRRDIQMVVSANCAPNNAPILTTIPPADTSLSGLQPKLSWEVCEGSQLCFDVVSRDRDTNSTTLVSDTTYLQWDSALASLGATFTPNYIDSTRKINGPREASYKFCWTPGIGTASNIPYIMVVKNNDSKCPLPGRNARGFSIRVKSIANISITKTNLGCGKHKLTYTNPTPTNPVSSAKWKIAKAPFDYTFASGADTFENLASTPILYFSAPGKYFVRLSLANSVCNRVLYDTILVDSFVKTDAMMDTAVCYRDSFALKAVAKFGTPPYAYRWFNSIKDTSLTPLNGPVYTSASFNVAISASKTYTIQVRDVSGCRTYDSVTIFVSPELLATLIPQHPSCFQKEDGQITASVSQGKSPFVYALDNGSFGTTNTFTNLAGNNYSVTIKDSMGCMLTLATTLITPLQIVAGTITGNSTVIQNIAESYSITPQTGLNYTWGIQKGTILSGQNTASVSVNWDSIGVGGIGVVVYSDSTCGDTATLVVNIGVNGLSELAKTFGLHVYPNPSSGLVNITLQKLPAEHSLKLYDMQGKLLIEQELKLSQQLNLESLPQGTYMLKIGEWRGQIIKK